MAAITLDRLLDSVVSARDGDGTATLAVLEHELHGDEMPPLHLHDEDEAYRVLEGRVVVYAGPRRVRLAAGDSFVAPKGVPHTHRAESPRARYLTMTFTRSATAYEDFARAVARPDRSAESSEAAEDSIALDAIARTAAITVLGGPGTLPAEPVSVAA